MVYNLWPNLFKIEINMIAIKTIQELQALAYRENGDFVHFNLYLAGGLIRSCKRISYRPNQNKPWLIINEIDESYQELSEQNLSKKTQIVEAINNNCFYLSSIP
jgi:hypothetical protein